MRYDLFIIGGGSVAFAAALQAAEMSTKKIGGVEYGAMGGSMPWRRIDLTLMHGTIPAPARLLR